MFAPKLDVSALQAVADEGFLGVAFLLEHHANGVEDSLFVFEVWLTFFREMNVVQVWVVGHVTVEALQHPVVYVVFFSVHENVFVEESDFFKHLFADEETGTGEVHIAAQIVSCAVTQGREHGCQVSVHHTRAGEGVRARLYRREHLLHAVHAQAAVVVKCM